MKKVDTLGLEKANDWRELLSRARGLDFHSYWNLKTDLYTSLEERYGIEELLTGLTIALPLINTIIYRVAGSIGYENMTQTMDATFLPSLLIPGVTALTTAIHNRTGLRKKETEIYEALDLLSLNNEAPKENYKSKGVN